MVDAFADRLADVARLEPPQFAGAFFDPVRDPADDAAARLGAHLRPWAMVGGLARRGDRALDVFGAGVGHLGEFALGRGLDVRKARAASRRNVLTADE